MGNKKRKLSTEPLSSNSTPIAHSTPGTSSKASKQKNANAVRLLRFNKTPDKYEAFQEKNPLLMHVVFSNLLKLNFAFRDIQQIRLVCKTWFKFSLTKWRTTAAVRLGSPHELWRISDPVELELSQSFHNCWHIEMFFLQYTDSNDFLELANYPYRKYVFTKLYFASNDIFPKTYAFNNPERNIWSVVGPEMQQLSFEQCSFEERLAVHLEQTFTQILLNLETLSFSNCVSHTHTYWLVGIKPINQEEYMASPKNNRNLKKLAIDGVLPMNLYVLLFNSPNIQSVELNSHVQKRSSLLRGLIEICNVKRLAEGSTFPVKQMKLNLRQESNIYNQEVWRIMKFPLEHLCYAATPTYRGTTGISELNAITEYSSETLKFLEVFQPPMRHAELLGTLSTQLNKMEEIYCYGNNFSTLSFLNQMPNLKVLYLDYKCLNNLDKVFELIKTLSSLRKLRQQYFSKGRQDLLEAGAPPLATILEKLECFHIDVELGSTSWSLVPQWMPNLKILEATLRSYAFTEVCKLLPNLEELVVLYDSYVTDSEITGISGSRERNPNNLTNIRGLKKFIMKRSCRKYKATGQFIESSLGDCSIYKGFLEMKNLEEV